LVLHVFYPMICIDTETIHRLSERNYENRMWLSLY